MKALDDIDRRLIRRVCDDLGEGIRPFADLSSELGMEEADVIRRLTTYRDEEILRRFGAVLMHQKLADGKYIVTFTDGHEQEVDSEELIRLMTRRLREKSK